MPRKYKFVQCDSSAIEAVMVGAYMGDMDYVRLAKQSIHAYLCCKWLRWPFTPENVKKVKKEQKDTYDRFKRVVHGTSYGMGPYLMHMNEPETFPTLKSAKDTQKFLFQALPGLQKWQHQVRVRAQKEGKLKTHWGVTHYFYDVFSYDLDDDGKPKIDPETGLEKMKLGKDGKRAVAFLPQSSAGSFMRDSLLLLGKSPWARYMPAIVSVHDSLCLEVPEEMVDEAAHYLLTLMTRPVPELDGLCIGAECETGWNWAKMEPYASWQMLDVAKEAA